MDNKMQKYLLVINSLILFINIFLIGWQIKGQHQLSLAYLALDKSVDALKSQHGAISATYQKRSSTQAIFKKKVRFCSTPDRKMALEVNPDREMAIYWPRYNHDEPESSEFEEYDYTISNGVVTLESSHNEVPYRIFKIIEVFHHDSEDIITGLSGGIDMYMDWCGG